MNRKSLIVLVAVLAVILVGLLLFVGISQAQSPTPSTGESTAPSGTGNNTQPSTDPSGEETEPSETEPSEEAVTTPSTQDSTEPTQDSTEPTQDSTEPTQPEPVVTLPPGVDVSMGVEEGDVSPDLEGDGKVHSATTQPTQPTQPTDSEPLDEDFDITTLTYESYNSMSGDQQMIVINLFASPEEFMRWYKAAEAKYKAEHPDIEIGEDGYVHGGSIG